MNPQSLLRQLALACASSLALATAHAQTVRHIGKVWYILLENRNFTQNENSYGEQIYGSPDAPFLNSLITPGASTISAQVSWCSAYHNALAVFNGSGPNIHPSEPNYVWFENGSNLSKADDNEPYGTGLSVLQIQNFLTANPAYTKQNLCALLQNASITWKAYAEGTNQLNNTGGNANLSGLLTATGASPGNWTVPLASFSGNNATYLNPYNHSTQWNFATKHTGSLFFPATNGCSTTSFTATDANTLTTNTFSANYPPLTQLAGDLTGGTCARLNVITPDQFNDGHTGLAAAQNFTYHGVNYGVVSGGGIGGGGGGPTAATDGSRVAQMDNFCAQVVPQIMASSDYTNPTSPGLIVIWTDETETSSGVQNDFQHTLLEVVISPLAKGNAYCSTLNYTHSSDLNTLQKIFQVPANTPTGFLNDAANPSNPTPASLVGLPTAVTAAAPLSGQASTPPSGYGTGQAYDLSDLFQSGVIPSSLPVSTNVSQSGFVLNRRTNTYTETVTVQNNQSTAITTPVYLALNNLSSNTSLLNKTGLTVNNAPVGTPYILVSNTGLAVGHSLTVTLSFTSPASGSISYTPNIIVTSGAP